MDEDIVQSQKAASDNPDAEAESDHIFDISPDLNISPVKDAEIQPAPAAAAVPPQQVDTPLANALSGLGINQLQQPARKIPGQNIPIAPQSPTPPRTTPANPPSKTFDASNAEGTSTRVPGAPLNGPGIKTIRTYESDVAELLSHTHTSRASIAIAETKKVAGEERIVNTEPAHSGRNVLLTLISLVLVGGGAYGAYYLYQHSVLAPTVPTVTTPPQQFTPALVPTDVTSIVPVDGLNGDSVIAKVREEMNKPLSNNSIREIVPVSMTSGNEARATVSAVLKKVSIPMPDMLTRSLVDPWMLGVYADANGNRSAFIVTKNSFFQNTFAGMLQWENTMPTDLKAYIGDTTTGQFTNKIIHNKDVREFVSADGHVFFLYSFVDTNTLIFASNEAALSEILNRLEKQALVR